jgi:oligoendopeptidase F
MTLTAPSTAETIRWDLSDLFSGIDDPKITETLAAGHRGALNYVDKYKEKLGLLNPAALADAFKELETLLSPLYKLSQYAHLVYSVDTANDQVKAFVGKVDDEESEISNHLVFFNLELAALSPTQLDTLAAAPELADYKYELELTKKTAAHNLTEKEEQLINLKDLTGVDAMRKLYNELTASFQFEFELDGNIQTMNGSQLRALRQHEDANVRRRAMKVFFERYEAHQITLSTIFNNVIKDFNTERKLRKYPTPISTKLIGKDLDDATIKTLHQVTDESYGLVQRYYTLKQKLMGLSELTLADIYAPLPGSTKTYTWDEAKTMVLDGFGRFDSEIHDMAKRMFDNNRIDAPLLPTKRGGAYCSSSTPDIDPYVFLNYQGRPSDVATLAHELGHAIHDMLCANQHLFYYHPILPLAETASVFSEMLITDKLLAEQTDTQSIQAILTDKLEDVFATSHRQNMFSNFELKTHDLLTEGLVSSTDLCDIYEGELKKMFGQSVVITPEYRWEWSSIPHMIDSPFYVFSYNFGNLLVMALYQQYKEEGAAFIPKYKQILAAGSSASPYDIVGIAGFDLRDPKFWRKGISVIEGLLVRLENTVK